MKQIVKLGGDCVAQDNLWLAEQAVPWYIIL